MTAVYPALLAIINNIAPYVEHLSPGACTKILQLFSSMSSPSFLLANESNHALLASVLESINSMLEHRFSRESDRDKKNIYTLTDYVILQKTRTLSTPS